MLRAPPAAAVESVQVLLPRQKRLISVRGSEDLVWFCGKPSFTASKNVDPP
jgi:hypothetical protein